MGEHKWESEGGIHSGRRKIRYLCAYCHRRATERDIRLHMGGTCYYAPVEMNPAPELKTQ